MRLSPSQIKVFMECPQMWKYSYIDNLALNRERRTFDNGLYFHQLVHNLYQLMEANPQYKPGSDFLMEAMRSRINSDLGHATSDNISVMATVIPIFQQYLQVQSPRIDAGITVLGVEQEIKVEWEDGIILHGYIDLIYRQYNREKVRDHKTSTKPNAWSDDKVQLEGQLLLYLLAWSILQGRPVTETEVNFINLYSYKEEPPLDKRFRVFSVMHDPRTIEGFGTNLRKIHKNMVDMNITRNLGSHCGNCAFMKLCQSEIRGDNIEGIKANYYVDKDSLK